LGNAALVLRSGNSGEHCGSRAGVRHEDRAVAHGAQWRGGEDDIDRARLRDGISDRRRRATTAACVAGSGRGECRDRLGTAMASFDDFRARAEDFGD